MINLRWAWIQAVDHIATRSVRISLHPPDGEALWIELDEQSWLDFRRAADDAMEIALGRKPPRDRDDPDFFYGVPTA